MNPLSSIKGVWMAGILLSVLLAALVHLSVGGGAFAFNHQAFLRWVHIIAGIIWVGLLYYFNFVQMPAVAAAAADTAGPGPGAIGKYVVPRALLWFRWAAVVTWCAGVSHLLATGRFMLVFSLGLAGSGDPLYALTMGIGSWLGTILLFNVWVLIWPNQKKILGLTGKVGETELASARKTVATVARLNAVLSIPMLMFMVAPNHGLVF
ncbi:MAG: hypothetical protein WBP72_00480 [Rhodocyclaceae bacterium]